MSKKSSKPAWWKDEELQVLFVEEVEKNRVLYDPSHENYKDVEKKDLVWLTIAEELALEGGGKY